MKIAVTSTGIDLDAQVDPRFGRAAYILIIDSERLTFEVLDNKDNINALKGAGIQAAKMVSDKKAEVLLTGFCGPNAFNRYGWDDQVPNRVYAYNNRVSGERRIGLRR